MCHVQKPDPYIQDQGRICSFKVNIVYLRNIIFQTVILLLNNTSDIMIRIRTTNSHFIKQYNHRFGYIISILTRHQHIYAAMI
jgi:hypothetical protein